MKNAGLLCKLTVRKTYWKASTNRRHMKKQQSIAVVWTEVKRHPNSVRDVVTCEFEMCIYCWECERNDVLSLIITHKVLVNMVRVQYNM